MTGHEVAMVVVAVLAAIGGYRAANGPAAAEAAPSRCATLPALTNVPEAKVEAILRRFGANARQAEETTDSFEGPIDLVAEPVDRRFRRYFSGKRDRGRYLTHALFRKSVSARLALYLPYANKATKVQTVTVTEATMVLEGGINLGRPGTKQFFVLQPDCFDFGKGKPVGR